MRRVVPPLHDQLGVTRNLGDTVSPRGIPVDTLAERVRVAAARVRALAAMVAPGRLSGAVDDLSHWRTIGHESRTCRGWAAAKPSMFRAPRDADFMAWRRPRRAACCGPRAARWEP